MSEDFIVLWLVKWNKINSEMRNVLLNMGMTGFDSLEKQYNKVANDI